MNFVLVYIEDDEATIEHYKVLDFADFVTLVPWHKGSVNEIIARLSEGSFSEPLDHKTKIITHCNLKSKKIKELIASELAEPEYQPIDYFFIYGLTRAPARYSEPSFTEGSKIIPVSVEIHKIPSIPQSLGVSLGYHKEIFINPPHSKTHRDFFQEIGGEEVLEKRHELNWQISPSSFQTLSEIKKYLKKKSKLRDNLFVVPNEKNHRLFGFADTF